MKRRWIVIRNWDHFQHYKDRAPSWIKDYTEQLDDHAYLALTFHQRGVLENLRLQYARSRGCLPLDLKMLNRKLAGDMKMESLEALKRAGFIQFTASEPVPFRSASRARTEVPLREPKKRASAARPNGRGERAKTKTDDETPLPRIKGRV